MKKESSAGKKILGFAGVGLGLMGAQQTAAAAAPQTVRQPNIILMMADDLSAKDMGCYGNKENHTPVLERLGREGILFETAWCTPICSPSRAEIMTGQYGFNNGWYHNYVKRGNFLERHTFVSLLKNAGYRTAMAGKFQLHGMAVDYPKLFDESLEWAGMAPPAFTGPVEGSGAVLPGRAARYWYPALFRNGELLQTGPNDYGPDLFVEFISEFAAADSTQPFLVYYPMLLPHTTWDFDKQKNAWLPTPGLTADGEPDPANRTEGSLKSNVQYIDVLIGRIIKRLEASGTLDNTILIFTSDNGTHLYGKAQVDTEKGPRVPLVVWGPNWVKPVGTSDVLVDFSDILPTLCDLAAVSVPDDYPVDGHSFAPLLQGRPFTEREWIFSYYADARFLRTKRWLLDGNNRFWDCGSRRDETQGYRDVTEDISPEVVAAKKQFMAWLEDLPAPSKAEVDEMMSTAPPRAAEVMPRFFNRKRAPWPPVLN